MKISTDTPPKPPKDSLQIAAYKSVTRNPKGVSPELYLSSPYTDKGKKRVPNIAMPVGRGKNKNTCPTRVAKKC